MANEFKNKWSESKLKNLPTHQFYKALCDIISGKAVYKKKDGTIIDYENRD